MPAHTAGRVGGSSFASKKAAASATKVKHEDTKVVVHTHHHPMYNSSPLILTGTSLFAPPPLYMTAVTSIPFEVGFITTVFLIQALAYIIWARFRD